MQPSGRRHLMHPQPLAATLVVLAFALLGCGSAGGGSSELSGDAALDCVTKHADGALDAGDVEDLAAAFDFEAISLQMARDRAVAAADENDPADYFPDPDLGDASGVTEYVPRTLSAFDSLNLEGEDAQAVYAAAVECGTDFRAIMQREAFASMPSTVADTPEASACVKKAVTDDAVAEYVVAVFGDAEASAYGSQFALWRTLHTCTPRQTLATAPDTTTETTAPDPEDSNGYFDDDGDAADFVPPPDTSTDGEEDVIEACLAFVAEQAGEIAAMLSEETITEADYERLMAENSEQTLNCLDLR